MQDYALRSAQVAGLLDDKHTGRWILVIRLDVHCTFAAVAVLDNILLSRQAN
jgi:hypothetical protein